jgi:hypothetical protein
MMDTPAKGDIWMDDEGQYYLYLTDPVYDTSGYITVTALWLNTGLREKCEFSFDFGTGTLHEWWKKVA